MVTRIYLTFVGQLREFETAIESQAQFVNQLRDAGNFVHVSYIVWSTSYSNFGNKQCFHKDGITAEYIQSKLPFAATIAVKSMAGTTAEFIKICKYEPKDFNEGFLYVAALHELSMNIMFEIERKNGYKFDGVILSRPDIYITEVRTIDLIDIPPMACYYDPGPAPFATDKFFGYDKSINISVYRDMVAVFGRAAFIVYGMMYRYLLAGEVTRHENILTKPSLHRWVPSHLTKFGVMMSKLKHVLQLRHKVIRPKLNGQPESSPITEHEVDTRIDDWNNQ